MRSRVPRRLGYLAAVSIVLLGTTGMLIGTASVPLAASVACACEGGGVGEEGKEQEEKERVEKEEKEFKERKEKEEKEKKKKAVGL
jgi:hypothetical protein